MLLLHSTMVLTWLCHFVWISSIISVSTSPTAPVDTYDFIVGGGTGGCAVAGRLSESGQYSVLLLEAGGIPTPALEVPAMVGSNLDGFLRTYQSVPQHSAGLETNGIIPYMTGRTLGGSSSVNGMMFNRGSKYDYDNWANVTNDQSWSYSSLLPYFKKAENYAGDFPSDQHGYNGPIGVSRASFAPGLKRWYQAGRELEYPISDPNGPQRISFAPVEFSQRNGRRVSSYTGYIKPYLSSRRNLRVLTNAEVSKIIFEGNRAVGVKYATNSTGRVQQTNYARAQKEIIVSAGVIESPLLLMKSGIGRKSVLEAAKIQQIKELPVGQGFHDQPLVFLDIIINNKSETFDRDRDLTPEAWRVYNQEGDGPYASLEGVYGQAFIRSSIRASDKIVTWVDLHLFFQNTPANNPFGIVNRTGLAGVQITDWETSIRVGIILGRPTSRGTVSLNPINVTSPPLIDFNMLSHPEDMEVMLEGIKTILNIYEQTAAYRKVGARYPPNPLPACQHLKFRSDEYWRCFIRQRSQSSVHGVGTCRMGSGPRDPHAVVDSSLRVIGMQRLRVVDASIMPAVTNTNTHAAVYGIAEKASDMILRRWDSSSIPKRFKLQLSNSN